MSSESLRSIMNSADKRIGETKNVLSRMCRLILSDLDVDAQTFDRKLNHYIHKLSEERGESNSSVKTNFTSALCKPSLSWKYFERFIKVLNPKSVRVIVEIDWHDDSTTIHKVPMSYHVDETQTGEDGE